MSTVHIFKYINYYTSCNFNLCYYSRFDGDLYFKNGWNVDQFGSFIHYQNNLVHREDGPAAIIRNDNSGGRAGMIQYWLNNGMVSVTYNHDFVKKNKLKAFW